MELFGEDAAQTNLDTQEAYEAFQFWTDLYGALRSAGGIQRGKPLPPGEMPLLIAPYTLYNTLTVFAPELRGEWGFAPVPGIRREDGTIDRTVPASGTAAVIPQAQKTGKRPGSL